MLLAPKLALVASGEARLTDELDCNCYLVDAPEGPVLIDVGAGRDVDRLLERCRETLGEPVAALLTHAHSDHSQGGPELQDRNVPVIATGATARLLSEGTDHELGLPAAKRDGVYPPEYEFTNYAPDRTIDLGAATGPATTVTVAGRSFEVVRFRGHARDHVCYVTRIDGRTACFVGDAVAPDGSISLLNVHGSSLADYREDVDNLAGYGIDALLPGHGLPRLADGQDAVDRAAEALAGSHSPPSRT